MMARAAVIGLALLVSAVSFADDYVIIRTDVPETSGLQFVPLVVSTDAAGLRDAIGVDELPAGVVYAEGDAGRPVGVQLDLVGDRAQFAALLPTDPPGRREVRVWLQNAPQRPPAPPRTVALESADGTLTVRNEEYFVVHDPAVNAGLLSQIGFTATGKVFEPTLNDRVHGKELGGFHLRKDSDAEVEVVASGPYMAQVRVTAAYHSGDQPAPSGAEATYTFRYWAGLPLIQAEAQVSQEQRFSWNELHFLEMHFTDESFTHFAIDDPAQPQEFADEKEGHRGGRWGALVDGCNVLGMTGSVIVYDGLGGYGRYLHGPWQQWATESTSFERWLLVSAAEDALQTLDANAAGRLGAGRGTILTGDLAELLGRLHLRALASSDTVQAARITWGLSLIEAAAAAGAPLRDVRAAADALRQAVGTPAWRRFPPELPGGRLLLADDGRLGVGLRVTDTGIELASLFDMVAMREMLAAPSELFELTLAGPEDVAAVLGSSEGWGRWETESGAEPGRATIEARFEGPLQAELGEMTAGVSCEITGGESRWWLSVENGTRWSIDQVAMPALRAVRLGDDGTDDALYVPQGFGRAFEGGTGARYAGYYPSGSCALQLLILSDATAGLYMAAHDAGAATKQMVTGTSSGGVPMSIEVPAPDASVAGNDFETPGAMVIARVDGGWYPASQKYRAWLQESAPWWPEGDPDYGRPDRPAWLDDIAAWVLTGGGPEAVVEPTSKFAQYMDLPVAVHWYNWHQIPFDNDYPHYFPTKEGIRQGVAQLQEAGVRVVPYINGRLWDTDTESFQTEAHLYCTRDRDGEPYIEVYGSGEELAPMCISQQYWRDTLHEIVMRLMTDVGVDGVYMDQIAAARPRLCYDADHGHPLAGGHWWVDGYRQLLSRIQEDIAEVSADKMLTTESNAEAYARWFDTYLMCNSLGDGLTPLFPAIYGSKILGFGRYMSAEDWDAPESLAQKQGQLFVWGTQLWWSQPGVINHQFAGPWLRDLARLRHQVREFFNEGRMLAPPALEGNDTMVTADWHRRGLQATTPAVLASAWGLADGRILLPIVNCSESPQQVTLVFEPERYRLAPGASVTVRRLGPESAIDVGTWTGSTRHEIELEGVEPAALVIAPAR